MKFKAFFVAMLLTSCGQTQHSLLSLPEKFDLNNVDGKSFVTRVKSQSGGTCWTFGTMASLESNLAITDSWSESGQSGEPLLAEYHLDWWNGFNKHKNEDAPGAGGLSVHQGGDYLVASAYFTRGEGAVRASDGNSFSSAPKQKENSYQYFYVRNIEWLSYGSENAVDRIKNSLMSGGVVSTAIAWSNSFYSNNVFYQPKSSSSSPNHAVAIVGWDDTKKTKSSNPGAWLAKNSWGSSWGNDGFFWISYDDKVAGRHPEMGAVAFRNVEPMRYSHIYYHDYHGWRDTKKDASEAFNVFEATSDHLLQAVSFFTAADDVEFTIKVFEKFENGQLVNEMSTQDGYAEITGFRTVDLNWPVWLKADKKFYIYLKLSKGGQPFDKTSDVPVLLCGNNQRTIVKSKASPGESYYFKNGAWVDLTTDESTANFCIKGLAD